MEKDSQNWMLDEVKETCNSRLNKYELINRLAIQKIEYGRTCLAELFIKTKDMTRKQV